MSLVTLPVPDVVPRDGNGKPLVVPKAGGKPIALVRMTTFVDAVEDKSSLTRWKSRSTLVGAARKPGVLDAARELDPEDQMDKRKLDALVEALMEAAGANEKREKGNELHGFTELADAGLPLPESASVADREDIEAYIEGTALFDVKHVERFCVVPQYGIGGTPDRVAAFCGPGPLPGTWFDSETDGLLITDVKTGNIEYGALKMAGQLAGYSRGQFYDHTKFPIKPALHKTTGKPLVDPDGKKALARWKATEVSPEDAAAAYTPMGDINQEWGVIIHLPAGKADCTLHWIDLTVGWETLELCETIRRQRSKRGVLIPMFGKMSALADEFEIDADSVGAV